MMTIADKNNKTNEEAQYSQAAQRSEEWFEKRRGKFTASNFHALLTKGRDKNAFFGKTATSLIYEKLTERMTGKSKQIFADALEWGTEKEPDAIRMYERVKKTKVDEVGFIPLSGYEDWCGGSPDGVIDSGEGIIEVKCPYNSSVHTEMLINKDIPKIYQTQMQVNMLVTGATYCDFVSYDPRVLDRNKRICIIRVERDDDYCNKIIAALKLAVEELKRLEDEI